MELQHTVTIMSKRAEEAAIKAYSHYTAESLDDVIKARKFFAKGYEQAEKDLTLTWEDVQLLDLYAMECQVEESNGRKFNSSQEFFEEVLRRFNKTKNE